MRASYDECCPLYLPGNSNSHVNYSVADFLLQDDTLESALCDLGNNGYLQPLLVKCNHQYCVKVDNSAVNIADCSCFAEAVEFLFMCFFVFNVEYPNELRIFYAFLEHLLGIDTYSKQSSTLSGFLHSLHAVMNHQ